MAGTGTGGAQFNANQHISKMSKQYVIYIFLFILLDFVFIFFHHI
jgi:hypothetical protein